MTLFLVYVLSVLVTIAWIAVGCGKQRNKPVKPVWNPAMVRKPLSPQMFLTKSPPKVGSPNKAAVKSKEEASSGKPSAEDGKDKAEQKQEQGKKSSSPASSPETAPIKDRSPTRFNDDEDLCVDNVPNDLRRMVDDLDPICA